MNTQVFEDHILVPTAVPTDELIGRNVERIGSKKDYTTGRKGIILEVAGTRVRVRWTQERDGSLITTCGAKPGNGVRTWVEMKCVALI
jgi:hypothetical protein